MSDEQYQCKPGDPTPFDKQPPAPPASDATPFQRLQAVADLDYNDSADEQGYKTVTEKIQKCRDLVTQYEQNNGFQSQEVRAAITEWAQKFRKDLRTTEKQLTSGYQTVGQARAVMRQARDLFNTNVSPELLSDGEKTLKTTVDVASIVTVPIGGWLVKMAADKYWDWLTGERDKKRNEYCQKILDDMNAQLNRGAEAMRADTDGKDWKKGEGDLPPSTTMPGLEDPNGPGTGGGGGGGMGGYDPSTGLGGGAGAGGYDASGLGDGGTYGTSDVDPYAAKGKDWMSEGFKQPGTLQDAPPTTTVDDLDGVGLVDRPMNQTVTPNGLVDGYTPPSATNYSDPRWDPSYKIPSSVADVSKAASAGTLGALGGAGAASALKGLGGAGGLSAKSLLAGGVPGAGGLGAAGAGGAGAGAAGSGAGASGLKGAAGLKGAGSGAGGMMGMGGAGAGAGGAGDDKKKKRRAFSGLFADQPDDMGPVWDPAHGPGSEDDGVVFEVDLDEWGL